MGDWPATAVTRSMRYSGRLHAASAAVRAASAACRRAPFRRSSSAGQVSRAVRRPAHRNDEPRVRAHARADVFDLEEDQREPVVRFVDDVVGAGRDRAGAGRQVELACIGRVHLT